MFFFFNDTATTEIYTLSLHDALPISGSDAAAMRRPRRRTHGVNVGHVRVGAGRSEEHTSELQSPCNLVCRLLLEKKKKTNISTHFLYVALRPNVPDPPTHYSSLSVDI